MGKYDNLVIMRTDKNPPEFLDLTGKRRVFRAREKLNQADLISHITQRAAVARRLKTEDR